MNCPEILFKLTFDLCFIFNWRGSHRVSAALKYAEKLAKSKTSFNDAIKTTVSYLSIIFGISKCRKRFYYNM